MPDVPTPQPKSTSPLAAPAEAILWMLVACAMFAAIPALIRHAITELHPFEVAFFRNLFGLAFMLPWLIRSGGLKALRTDRLGLYTLRAGVSLIAMLTWFVALAHIELGDAVALSFTAPLFATVLAASLLGESVGARRWSATVVGFLGALIIIRPGHEEFGLGTGLVLVSAACIAVSIVLIKMLSRTEPSNAIVVYMVLFLTPASLPPALFVWTWPSAEMWLWLVVLGGVATLSHVCFTRAVKLADASALMPYDYTRLPFAAALAFVFFGEVPDLWTWIGAAVIAAASAYIARREARLGRSPTARGTLSVGSGGGPIRPDAVPRADDR